MTKRLLFAFACILFLSNIANAQIYSQAVTLAVNSTSIFTVSGNPAAMTVSTANAGNNVLVSVTENSTTYSVTHNSTTTKRITAAIDVNLPTDITLQVTLASGKGISDGPVILTTTPTQVVHSITKGADKTNMVTYVFSALASAGDMPARVSNVIFTFTN